MGSTAVKPARRFLHICYCCHDVEPVTEFLVNGLGLRLVMRTPKEWGPGKILGIDRDTYGETTFVYDQRGARVSPAVEVQAWIDPALEGAPSLDPLEVGVKALGFSVRKIDETVARLTGMGCTVAFNGRSPFGLAARMVDATGVTIEIMENALLSEGHAQFRHLRVTSTNLDASLPFYERLGFALIERASFSEGSWAGAPDAVDGEFARLRLPDEPFEVQLVQWNTPASHGRHYANPQHAGLFRMALGVEDTRAAYEELKAEGVVFERPPMDVILNGTPVPEMWICFLNDPDGVPFEFVQRPRAAFK